MTPKVTDIKTYYNVYAKFKDGQTPIFNLGYTDDGYFLLWKYADLHCQMDFDSPQEAREAMEEWARKSGLKIVSHRIVNHFNVETIVEEV